MYFKAGHCEKGKHRHATSDYADSVGNKCKFSHDKNVERKVEKVNIYEDSRKDDKKTGQYILG